MKARAMFTVVAGSAALVGASFGGCSLDLDESLIPDGGHDATSELASGGSAAKAGASGTDGGSGKMGSGGTSSEAGSCLGNADCPSQGCVQGSCVNGTCQYAICPGATACEARSCNADGTCGAAQTLAFHAGSFNVGQDLGCGGSVTRCFAAFGDYVLVGTADGGLLGWRVTDPLAPKPIAVDSPPFAITELVQSEHRVLLIGPIASGKLSIAWIDLPSDPALTTLTNRAVALTFTGAIDIALPAAGDAFFLVKYFAAEFYPAALLALPATGTIAQYPSTGIAAGATIVASSGSRLVSFRVDGSSGAPVPVFSLENDAGTPNAQNAGELPLTAAGEASTSLAAHAFTSGYEGSVLWSTNRIKRYDGGQAAADAVVFRWPILGATGALGATRSVVVESYGDYGIDEPRAGPSGLVDTSAAVVTAADPANIAQTAVRSVTRSGDTLTLGAGRHVLPFAPTAIGVAAGRRYGYLLTPSTTTPSDAMVHVFAPACG